MVWLVGVVWRGALWGGGVCVWFRVCGWCVVTLRVFEFGVVWCGEFGVGSVV